MNLGSFVNSFASDGPHIAIAPEKLFEVGGFTITNSMLYGWICAVLVTLLLVWGAKKVKIGGSRGFGKIIDFGTDFMISTMESSLGSRQKAIKYAPFFATTFFFIVLNNWLGLLPGIGPAIHHDGIPLLRPFTADLNGTLAIALIMMIIVISLAVRESGVLKHLRHYFPGSFKNPMTYPLGILELVSEFTRLVSLALRLFLNVVIGEILIAIFAYLGAGAAPLAALPFTLLELFVGLLQAYIFVVLCISYLAVATSHNNEHQEHA